MRGRRWAVMAALVAAGRLSLSAHSTGSPAFAAHAAAGIAYSGALDGATTTASCSAAPAAAVWSLSIACGERGRVGALDVGGLRALGLGGLADPDDLRRCRPSRAPVGPSASSADFVASGMSSPSESSTGARSGRLISWAAEIAACQSFASTSVTAAGRVSRERAG